MSLRNGAAVIGQTDACTYPTREHHHRLECGNRTVAVYVLGTRRYLPRCARHDGANTRRQAEAMGASRTPIEEWNGG